LKIWIPETAGMLKFIKSSSLTAKQHFNQSYLQESGLFSLWKVQE